MLRKICMCTIDFHGKPLVRGLVFNIVDIVSGFVMIMDNFERFNNDIILYNN